MRKAFWVIALILSWILPANGQITQSKLTPKGSTDQIVNMYSATDDSFLGYVDYSNYPIIWLSPRIKSEMTIAVDGADIDFSRREGKPGSRVNGGVLAIKEWVVSVNGFPATRLRPGKNEIPAFDVSTIFKREGAYYIVDQAKFAGGTQSIDTPLGGSKGHVPEDKAGSKVFYLVCRLADDVPLTPTALKAAAIAKWREYSRGIVPETSATEVPAAPATDPISVTYSGNLVTLTVPDDLAGTARVTVDFGSTLTSSLTGEKYSTKTWNIRSGHRNGSLVLQFPVNDGLCVKYALSGGSIKQYDGHGFVAEVKKW